MQRNTQVRELPMLAGIAGIIRWVEELANLLSGPLLTLGLGITLIDLLTDGSLLARLPLLVYAWAISQAVGVDAQLVATWDRAGGAARGAHLGAGRVDPARRGAGICGVGSGAGVRAPGERGGHDRGSAGAAGDG